MCCKFIRFFHHSDTIAIAHGESAERRLHCGVHGAGPHVGRPQVLLPVRHLRRRVHLAAVDHLRGGAFALRAMSFTVNCEPLSLVKCFALPL